MGGLRLDLGLVLGRRSSSHVHCVDSGLVAGGQQGGGGGGGLEGLGGGEGRGRRVNVGLFSEIS